MPEHHKIVIQAAVRALLGPRARVMRITPAAAQANPWARQGRLAIQGSHALRARAVRFLPEPGANTR